MSKRPSIRDWVLTPWFEPHVKPHRVGVYLTRGWGGAHPLAEWCHWDGVWWSAGQPSPSAAAGRRHIGAYDQNRQWRGLRTQPVSKADELQAADHEATQVDTTTLAADLDELAKVLRRSGNTRISDSVPVAYAAAELRRLAHNNRVLTDALRKACGDNEATVTATIESQGELK